MILIEDNDQQTAELSNLDSFSILNVETRLLRNAPTRFLNFLFWLLIWFFQRFWKIFTFFTNQVTNAAIVSCFLMRLWSQWVQLCPGFSASSLPLADCYGISNSDHQSFTHSDMNNTIYQGLDWHSSIWDLIMFLSMNYVLVRLPNW